MRQENDPNKKTRKTSSTKFRNFNPDVLNCLANLSNDEVFTPPNVVDKMLDLLPQEIFADPNATFLDPVCKSGVFLRQIAKRLLVGLKDLIPDQHERLEHILKNQLYGIAITELTSLIARRTLYCSKYANSPYSIVKFPNVDGNIRFKRIEHQWERGKCKFCGASQNAFGTAAEKPKENHAYEWIHRENVEDIFRMKFDVIIGNPPYQIETGGAGKQAKPLYNLFVNQAKKLDPKYLVMIIKSGWFSGGMGLDNFRNEMMHDSHITKLVDFTNAKDCFPQNSIGGGVCYFLRERDVSKPCEFVNVHNGNRNSTFRYLNEFPVLVRYNNAVSIIKKIQQYSEEKFEKIVSPLMPYGLSTNVRGTSEKQNDDDLTLYSSEGISYFPLKGVSKGKDTINSFRVLVSKTGAEHAGEAAKDGTFRVLTSSMKVIKPGEICTHSYFIIGNYDKLEIAENVLSYLKTKFVRLLIHLSMSSINVSKLVFTFVPMQDFTRPWSDAELYAKYGLTDDEIAFVESMIRPMEL